MAFEAFDWVVFSLLLLISVGMGIFFWWRDRQNQSVEQYVFAGKKLELFPITLSLVGSFVSALAMLGMPAEVYQNGWVYVYYVVSAPLQASMVAFIILPVYDKIRLTSIYEYLEMRFHVSLRILAALVFIVEMLLYLSLVLYIPCTAVETLMNIDPFYAVLVVGLTCTVYTTFGGIKGVVWTDVFQVTLMFVAIGAVLIQGFIVTNGAVFHIAAEGGRINMDNFSLNPWERHTFWNLFIGGAFIQMGTNGCSQNYVQKLLSLPTLRKSQIAAWTGAFGWALAILLCTTCGLIMYAVYGDCDPLSRGSISANNQLMSLFVDQYLAYPGVRGLFVAGIFSAALSSLAGGFSSLAAVAMRDIVKRILFKDMTDKRATWVTKGLTFLFGVTCTFLTIPTSQLGNLLQAAQSIFGWTCGPMLGLFSLGMVVPWTNTIGAHAGFWTSLTFMGWIYLGYYVLPVKVPGLPISTAGCPANTTITSPAPIPPYPDSYTGVTAMYTLSYMWYGACGWVIAVVVGTAVSFLTGKQDISKLDRKLITPIVARLLWKNSVEPVDDKHPDEHDEKHEQQLIESTNTATATDTATATATAQSDQVSLHLLKKPPVAVPLASDTIELAQYQYQHVQSQSTTDQAHVQSSSPTPHSTVHIEAVETVVARNSTDSASSSSHRSSSSSATTPTGVADQSVHSRLASPTQQVHQAQIHDAPTAVASIDDDSEAVAVADADAAAFEADYARWRAMPQNQLSQK